MAKGGGELALGSPDGTLYYSKQSGDDYSLWKLSSNGAEIQVPPSIDRMTSFVVAQRGTYFMQFANEDGSTLIELLRFADGKIETLANVKIPTWFGLSVAPDEQSIVYTQVDHEPSNLMIVEHFR